MHKEVKLIYLGMLNSRCRREQAFWRTETSQSSYIPWAQDMINTLKTEAAIPSHVKIDKESNSLLIRDIEWWTK